MYSRVINTPVLIDDAKHLIMQCPALYTEPKTVLNGLMRVEVSCNVKILVSSDFVLKIAIYNLNSSKMYLTNSKSREGIG